MLRIFFFQISERINCIRGSGKFKLYILALKVGCFLLRDSPNETGDIRLEMC